VPHGKMGNLAVVLRSYKLKLYGNKSKIDTARYTIMRFNQYTNMFLGRHFFGEKKISTKGMGELANTACYKSYNIIKSLKRLQKKTKIKTNVPYVKNLGAPAHIYKSENSTFDYWVFVSNLWTKRDRVKLPAKSHRAFNKALREGWKFQSVGECKLIQGNLYVIVYVKKEMPKPLKINKIIGYDIGIKNSVVSSEGYLGHGLSKILKAQKRRHAERRRQQHKVSFNMKSCIKQILDIEAKLIIRRSLKQMAYVAVESPSRIANLSRGNLQGWATSYLANRLTILGKECGVLVLEVNPYQTSTTCSKCGVVDKRSRATRDCFICISCNHKENADINSAQNIAQRALKTSERDFLLKGRE